MCHVILAHAKVKIFLCCTVVIMIHLDLEEFLSCDLIRLVQQNPHLSNFSYVMQRWERTFSFFSPQMHIRMCMATNRKSVNFSSEYREDKTSVFKGSAPFRLIHG